MKQNETKSPNPPLFFAKGEALGDLVLLAGILFGLFFLISFPSFKLSKMTERSAPFSIPNFINSGSMFILDGIPDAYELRINGKKLTPIFENVSLLGGVGISQRDYVQMTGVYHSRKRNRNSWLKRQFTHNELSYFSKTIRVSPSQEIENAQKLRLPSSVWKKVGVGKFDEKANQSLILRNVLRTETILTDFNCWYRPLSSKVTSEFGTPRTLPNGRQYFHSGVDLRAKTPTPILAMGNGEVVIARKMIVPGNIVVINHGGGLFSRYFHLSKVQVAEGKRVLRGQQLGLSGDTGRVNAPHLHWEVIWKGQPINPFSAIATWKKICEEGQRLTTKIF